MRTTATLEQIAEMTGLPVERVREAIQGLIDAGYLTPIGPDRYKLTIPEGRRPTWLR